MIWILLAAFSILLVVTAVRSRGCPGMSILSCFSGILTVILFCMAISMMADCMDISYRLDDSIEAIEGHNDDLLRQIRPMVLRNSSEDMVRLYGDDVSGMIMLSQHGELAGNQVLQRQVSMLLDNQQKLCELEAEAYKSRMYKAVLFAFWM